MNPDLYELVQKILWGVSFIAVGGALVVMFFLVFAQSIVGSRTISTQLEKLLQQNEQISRQLKQLIEHLERQPGSPRKES
jgi:predicted PurR-regulated permease PerM